MTLTWRMRAPTPKHAEHAYRARELQREHDRQAREEIRETLDAMQLVMDLRHDPTILRVAGDWR